MSSEWPGIVKSNHFNIFFFFWLLLCGPLSTDFEIYCDLRNLSEIHKIAEKCDIHKERIIVFSSAPTKRTPKKHSRDSSRAISQRNRILDEL